MWAFVTRGDGIDALERVDRPVPSPGPHEVLVRMAAVGLNYRDLLVINGVDGWRPSGARVPISDGVGHVVAAGAGATRFTAGDRVAGVFLPRWLDGELTAETYASALGGPSADGVMAEYRVFNEEAVVAVPSHLTDAEAAVLPVAGVTAWHAVRYRSDVQPGDLVLIQGAGGVSLFALQFAHALGARTLVLSSSDEKLARVRALGAEAGINYERVPQWETAVLARTGGRGVDHVIEVVGAENLNRSLRAVRVSGTISFIGLLGGRSAPIDTYAFVTRNVRLHGIETGSRAMFEDMVGFVGRHALRPILSEMHTLPHFRQALRQIESGRPFGKVAVSLLGG